MPPAANAPHLPRSAGRAGTVRSFTLAFVVHGLLFAFLYFGIRWQSRPPAAIEAELWSEPPRPAAPAPVTLPQPAPEPPKAVVREEPKAKPEPAPRRPDIAEKEEKKKPEPKKKDEKTKIEPKKEEKPQEDPFKAAAEKEINQREAVNKATRELAALKSSSAENAANQRKLEAWADQVRSLIRRDVRSAIADAVIGNPEAVFEVRLASGPRVVSVRKLKSSGNLPYDEAAQRAIEANERLPAPPAGVVLDPVLVLRMRPTEE
jgi:colicin import membrane protein